jgi:hypothetical protein
MGEAGIGCRDSRAARESKVEPAADAIAPNGRDNWFGESFPMQ